MLLPAAQTALFVNTDLAGLLRRGDERPVRLQVQCGSAADCVPAHRVQRQEPGCMVHAERAGSVLVPARLAAAAVVQMAAEQVEDADDAGAVDAHCCGCKRAVPPGSADAASCIGGLHLSLQLQGAGAGGAALPLQLCRACAEEHTIWLQLLAPQQGGVRLWTRLIDGGGWGRCGASHLLQDCHCAL